MSRSRSPRPGTVVNYEVTGKGTPESPAAVLFDFSSHTHPKIAAMRAALPKGTRLDVQPTDAGGGYKFYATDAKTSRNDTIQLWLELTNRMNWRFGHIR